MSKPFLFVMGLLAACVLTFASTAIKFPLSVNCNNVGFGQTFSEKRGFPLSIIHRDNQCSSGLCPGVAVVGAGSDCTSVPLQGSLAASSPINLVVDLIFYFIVIFGGASLISQRKRRA